MAAPNTVTTSQLIYKGDKNPDGVTVGQTITDKVSFYGVTPVVQRASASQAAVVTTQHTSTTDSFGFATSNQAMSIITLVNELRAALVAVGIIKGSA
jgi:UDP-N-acetyl-D-mannosaminuronic acid transferase (WecB/TagA/CpsF family)